MKHYPLKGIGIGIKSNNQRNLEAGILTDEPTLIDSVFEQLDKVWREEHYTRCCRRKYYTNLIK